MSTIVIVGANHAGTAAANAILDNHPGNDVIIFDQNSNISFLGCGMALWIGRQISKPDGLFYQTKEQFEAKGAAVHMETRVDHIDYDAQMLYAEGPDGKTYEQHYDRLILATGSVPVLPRWEGRDLENIQQVKLFQDAQAVIEKLKDEAIRRVAVVGAGYIGVELAEAFQRCGKEVTLIDQAPTCASSNFDAPFSERMAENLSSHGIHLAFGETVEHFEGKDGKVASVVTDKGTHAADLVCVCVGFRPNAELFCDAGFATLGNGALLVDHHQETSKKGVYAIGDCSSCFDNAEDGEAAYIALATNAVRSGIVAGHNAAGTAIDGIGVQGSSGICIYDLKMVATGLTEAKAKKLGYDAKVSDFTDVQKATFIETENPEVTIRVVYDGTTRKVRLPSRRASRSTAWRSSTSSSCRTSTSRTTTTRWQDTRRCSRNSRLKRRHGRGAGSFGLAPLFSRIKACPSGRPVPSWRAGAEAAACGPLAGTPLAPPLAGIPSFFGRQMPFRAFCRSDSGVSGTGRRESVPARSARKPKGSPCRPDMKRPGESSTDRQRVKDSACSLKPMSASAHAFATPTARP